MRDRAPIRSFCLAPLLALYPIIGTANPWQCNSTAEGLWNCDSAYAAEVEQQPHSIPAAEPNYIERKPTTETTPAEIVRKAADTTPTDPAPSAQLPLAPALDTPLFPTTIAVPHEAAPGESEQTVTQPSEEITEQPPDRLSVDDSTIVPATVNHADPAPAPQVETTDAISSDDSAVSDETPAEFIASTEVIETVIAETSLNDVAAYTRWSQCPPVDYRKVVAPAAETGVVELQADNARARDNNIFTLDGNAVAEMDWQRLEADSLAYDQQAGRIDATGNLLYTSPELLVDGERGTLFPDTDSGTVEQAVYALPQQHARGTASSLELNGRDFQTLRDVSYTTCPVSSTDWEIFAETVDLDQKEGTGVARHARVELKGVPVLYTPYLSFPLDDRRKSGLLIPRVGITDETGFDLTVPYYWNIAPHRDMTIVPRFMSDRGIMLGGEFRYKNKTNRGTLSGEYIPSDRKFDDKDRHLVGFKHRGNPLPRLETSIIASDVSDDFYFDDFGRNLVQTSQTNLERTARAAYHGRNWNLGIMVQNYQTIDPTISAANRPYEQLPRILFDMAPASRFLGMKFDANVEANNFIHSGNVRVDGSRVDIQPRISLPVHRPGWYVDPSVSVRYTAYKLDDSILGNDNSPTRTTPIASLDAGSVFERYSRWGNTDYVQTLEPRLFYLYVPEDNQDDIPIFDTSEYDFNFWTLFQENRFSGPDRMGDANQLAVALTSRLLDPASGIEQLSVSVGSLLYFRDREVTLPGEAVETDSTSNIIGELTLGLTHNWRAKAETQWNPHESQFDRNSFHLQYRKGQRQLVNIAYRYRRGIQEQADISALWPLGNNWHLVGRWYYSLREKETLEALAGLGYESCCWSVQLVGRSFVKGGDERNNAFFMQVELKGLGKLVNTVDKALERGILGYESLNDP